MSEVITVTQQTSIFTSFVDYCSVQESTLKGYSVCLRAFARWMDTTGISNPTKADIRDYVRYLDGSELKPGTKRQYFRAVKHLYKWASAEGLCPDVTAGIKGIWKQDRQHHKKDALGREDVQKVAGTIDRSTEQGKRLYSMLLLGIVDGLRTVELTRANIGDVKMVNGRTYLYVWGKGHSEPDTPVLLPEDVKTALDEYLEARTDNPTAKSPLFVSTSNRSKGKRIAPSTVSKILKEMLKKAGYDSDRLTAHSLRHTSGTGIYKATHNLFLTQQHLRHVNPETSEIYMHCDERESRNTEEQVYRYYFLGKDEVVDNQQEAVSLIQTLPAEKLEKALAVLRAIQ